MATAASVLTSSIDDDILLRGLGLLSKQIWVPIIPQSFRQLLQQVLGKYMDKVFEEVLIQTWTAAGRGKTFTIVHPSSEVLCAHWIVSSVYNTDDTSADKHRNCYDQVERNDKDKKAAFLCTLLIGNLGTAWDIRSFTHTATSPLPLTSHSLISSSTIPVEGKKVNKESFPPENISSSESSPVSQDRDECLRERTSGLKYLNREGRGRKRHYLDNSCSLAVSALCIMGKI